ncbi:MAG: DUF1761 domain-containing protein [Steroidobacteraceae bacterium]|mgnify:FL=1|jgi:hypothetical protein
MNASDTIAHLNWLAVVAAALAGFVTGGLWYGPLFGKAWMKASGVTEAQARARNPLRVYGPTVLLNLVAAFSLAMFVGGGDLQFGLFAGFMTGATFVATALGVTFLFEGRPLSLWLIDAGYQTLNFTVMGAILGGWH